jgi:hypothetical protein
MVDKSIFNSPYSTGTMVGVTYVKKLLHPKVKQLFDVMSKTKNCYIGISENTAQLFIDDQPIIKIETEFIEQVKLMLNDDVKEYNEMTEYRLSIQRKRDILIYYQSY